MRPMSCATAERRWATPARCLPSPSRISRTTSSAASFRGSTKAQKPTGGQALYQRFCANCHGSNGLGGRVHKDIVEEANEGADELLETVRKGHGGSAYGERDEYMPAWTSAQLSNDDVTAIAAYLRTLPGKVDTKSGSGGSSGGGGSGGGGDDDDDHHHDDDDDDD